MCNLCTNSQLQHFVQCILSMLKASLLMSSPDYLFDLMHAATLLPSVFSAQWQSEAAVTDGGNAAQAAGSEPGNTTPLEPEVW